MGDKLFLVAGVFLIIMILLTWYAYKRTQKLNRAIEENNKLVDEFNQVGAGEAIDWLKEELGIEIEKPKKFKKRDFRYINKAVKYLEILAILWFVWFLLLELSHYLGTIGVF